MLATVLPHSPVTKSSAKRLENGANAEHQLRGQKLDASAEQRQGHSLPPDDEDKINFGPAVVSHLRAGGSGSAAGGSSVSPIAGGGAESAGPAPGRDDSAFLSPLNSPDRISLSGNARALADGLRASEAGQPLRPPAVAAAVSSGTVEARSGNVGQRGYETVRWKEFEPEAGARVEGQNPQSAVVEEVAAAQAAAESGEADFGESVKDFFHNLRSRLWGQAVAAYAQPPVEVERGRRLHIQV